MKLRENHFKTPLGMMISLSDDNYLYLLEFEERKNLTEEIRQMKADIQPGATAISKQIEQEISEYFAGKRQTFDTPLKLTGTDFQNRVWTALCMVPYGQTASYKDLANALDKPGASVAVGSANAKNKLALIVPCHRVIKTDGDLAGYAAGLERKEWLIAHEKGALKA